MFKTIGIIGMGKVGLTLAHLLHKKGLKIAFLISSSKEKREILREKINTLIFSEIPQELPQVDIIFITTPDGVISSIAEKLVKKNLLSPNTIVVHTSGLLNSEKLQKVEKSGAYRASMHPLKSFGGRGFQENEDYLKGTYFALEGERQALEVLTKIITLLGGIPLKIKTEQKILYHAAAVAASNYLVSLSHYAVHLLKEAGINEDKALSLLQPLMEGTLNNIFKHGPLLSLTGPIERGDKEILLYHKKEIKKVGTLEEEIYNVLGKYTTRVAEQKKPDMENEYTEIKKIFEGDL